MTGSWTKGTRKRKVLFESIEKIYLKHNNTVAQCLFSNFLQVFFERYRFLFPLCWILQRARPLSTSFHQCSVLHSSEKMYPLMYDGINAHNKLKMLSIIVHVVWHARGSHLLKLRQHYGLWGLRLWLMIAKWWWHSVSGMFDWIFRLEESKEYHIPWHSDFIVR